MLEATREAIELARSMWVSGSIPDTYAGNVLGILSKGSLDELKNLDEHLEKLQAHIEEDDYCYLCDNHPSSGHNEDCPFWVEIPAEE